MIFLSMLGLMVSGIILSREVFAFLPISGGTAFARSLHMFSGFWGFVLMALHLGLHWNMILGMVRKAAGEIFSGQAQMILRIIAALIAGYGFYAFIKNQFLSYMFLTSSFVFFDFNGLSCFFTEYIAIMDLLIFLTHYTSKGDSKAGRKEEKTCGEKEINIWSVFSPFCSCFCCHSPGAVQREKRRRSIRQECLLWVHT